MIIFENIDSGETVGISQESEGKYYRAKLSAYMNSSDLNVNADRGQDHGWRLQAEQRAIIEAWESDGVMIDKVSTFTKVPIDILTHTEFLAYLLHEQELGVSPDQASNKARQANQTEYARRVAELKAEKDREALPTFDASTVEEKPKTVAKK